MIKNQLQEKPLEKEFNEISIKKNEIIQSQVKDLYLLTINHKTAPVPIREKFAIPDYNLTEAITFLKEVYCNKPLQSFLILSTCNRTEIYFTTSKIEDSLNDIYSFFNKYLSIEQKVLKEYSMLLREGSVIEHAFNVASGLDSLVLGESQVLSQVKNAYSIAQKEKTLDKTLELLFQEIIKSAKEIHKKTNLSKSCQSISSAAIDLACQIAGPLKTKSIMVLGAGKMSKLALEQIVKLDGSKETIVLNRSPHRVIEFPQKYKIDRAIPFENVYEVLNEIDILICAAGAPHFIIFAKEFKEIRKDINKPLYIFDISMPRNIDSEFGKLDNVKLFDIDSLQEIYNKSTKIQQVDLEEAKKVISEGIGRFYKKISNEEIEKLIKDLKEKFEKTRKEKLAKLKKKKISFTGEETDYITKNIVNTVLHSLTKNLKNSYSQKSKIETLRDLFEI